MPADDLEKLAALEEPLRRRLFEHVRRSPEPVGREAAAEAVGIGRSLAAYHLDKLVEEGLLSVTYARPEGRGGPGAGRPAKLYAVQAGEVSVSIPPRDYELAARLLAEAAELPGEPDEARAEAARRGGQRLAAEGGSLLDALTLRGYEPYEDDGVTRLRNCPFHRLAEDHRDLVCGMNLAYLDGLLAGLGRDDLRASLEPEPGRCCVAIRRRAGAGRA